MRATRRAWITRAGIAATVITVGLLHPFTATASVPTDQPIRATSSSEFMAALNALPAAHKAIKAAENEVPPLRENAAHTRELLGEALTIESRTAAEVTLAQQQADTEQAEVEGMARAMYMSGGTATPLDPFLAEPDSPESLTRAMDTQAYLETASLDQISQAEQARDAVQVAIATHQTAVAQKDAAIDAVHAADDAVKQAEDAVLDAKKEYQRLLQITSQNPDVKYEDPGKCGDWLVRLLARTGFEGENLREAWAIVMRESGGNEKSISVSRDFGLFQINEKTWSGQPWWDEELLLTREYNAAIGYQLSQGGDNWYSWGLDGHGRVNAQAYYNSGWTEEDVQTKIVEPYLRWYSQYPCRPDSEVAPTAEDVTRPTANS